MARLLFASKPVHVAAGLGLVLLVLSGCAAAHAPPAPFPSGERPADIWQYLADAADAGGARPDRFVSYQGGGGRSHRIAVFEPGTPVGESLSAGLVLFHGGAWREGAPLQFYRQAQALADIGFVVFLPEYAIRDEDGTTPRDAVLDAFLAWRAVNDAAADLGVAADHLYAGGASAGGHLAAALGTTQPPPTVANHTAPAGLVLFNPVLDTGPTGYGHARVQDYWQEVSPIHNVGDTHPPTLIMVGDRDTVLPLDTAEAYCAQVRATGAPCALKVFAGTGHAWFNYDPAGYADTLDATIQTLTTWTRTLRD